MLLIILSLALGIVAPQRLAAVARPVKVILVGDSTVTDGAGWGLGFRQFLTDGAVCVNTARGGRSSLSFMREGSWTRALALKGDYYIIQFGHNNEPGKPGRSTDMATFVANMEQYVDDARRIGAKPILVTPLTRRQWDPGRPGKIRSSLAPYAAEVRNIGLRKGVPIVDLQARSIALCEKLGQKLGPQGCLVFSPLKTADGKIVHDATHLNIRGRVLFARLVVEELRKNVPELAGVLRSDPLEAFPIAKEDGFDAVVSAGGSGGSPTLQAAIAAAPDFGSRPFRILAKPGVYPGPIFVPASKTHLWLVGADRDSTILSYDRNVREFDPGTDPRYRGTGVIVLANDFRAEDLTFENTSGDHGQALALRVDSDRAEFVRCRMRGWQDTLMVNAGRQYFEDCAIEGRVDFIYGSATAVFDRCDLLSKNGGHVTAASTPKEKPFGFVFLDCRLTGDPRPWAGTPASELKSRQPFADLGRPWRPYACVAYVRCYMGDHIRPQGWNDWGKPSNEKTARYAEYRSTGPGADPSARVPWSKQLTDEQAKAYTVEGILGGADGWMPAP